MVQIGTSLLTDTVIVDVVVTLAAVDPQKHLIVVVLVPVEGQDPGPPSLWVSTEEAGYTGHQLGEGGGTSSLEQRGHHLQELLRALLFHQLGGKKNKKKPF